MNKVNAEVNPGRGSGVSRLREWVRNPISLLGLVVAVVAFGNFLFLFFIDLTSQRSSPYVGILAYMIAPAFLIAGLVLVPVGVWYDRRKRRQQPGAPVRYLHIDFNDPSPRGALAFVFTFVIAFIGLSVVGSYRAYEFTDWCSSADSSAIPLWRRNLLPISCRHMPRVACVDCHAGGGVTWYVKSKLSGARQVFATAFKTYPRPIPTPVHNLRPAAETCEQCHWPRSSTGPSSRPSRTIPAMRKTHPARFAC
jgi:hypothetical protein